MSDGPRSIRFTLALVVALLTAGCGGMSLGGLVDGGSSPTVHSTPVDADDRTATPEVGTVTPRTTPTGNISVGNYRYDRVTIQVVAVEGNLTAVNWTDANGSVRTVSRDGSSPEWTVGELTSDPSSDVRAVEPANGTVVGRWSVIAGRNSTAYFPTVDDGNVSYLVSLLHPERNRVLEARVVSCPSDHPKLRTYEVDLGEPSGGDAGSSTSVGCSRDD